MDQTNHVEEVNENNVASSNVPELKVEKTEVINDLNFVEVDGEWKITSLEIARFTGKAHKDVLESIRNMEPAWVKLDRRKFPPISIKDSMNRLRTCYILSEPEAMYILAKYNDDIRARVVDAFYKLKEMYEKGEIISSTELSQLIPTVNKLIEQNSALVVQNSDLINLLKRKDNQVEQLVNVMIKNQDVIVKAQPQVKSDPEIPTDENGLMSVSDINRALHLPQGWALWGFYEKGYLYKEGTNKRLTEEGKKYLQEVQRGKFTNVKFTITGLMVLKKLISSNWDISKVDY